MSEELLKAHKTIWDGKPIIRYLYQQWYQELSHYLQKGLTLEVGGGSGNLKEFSDDVICTDVSAVPWLDAVVDAQTLPFKNECFNNIVLFDVLHHIENPTQFIDEALRTLRPKGRLIMMEPHISCASWPIYHFLHPEPVNLKQDPFTLLPADPNRKPFDANQAIPSLMFLKYKKRFNALYPSFKFITVKYRAFIAYPLSGGFDKPAILPTGLLKLLSRLEKILSPLGKLMAFRILIILEKELI